MVSIVSKRLIRDVVHVHATESYNGGGDGEILVVRRMLGISGPIFVKPGQKAPSRPPPPLASVLPTHYGHG